MEEDESVFAETTVTGNSEYRPRIVPESDTGSRFFRQPQPEVKPKNDLSGKRFGKLTALRPTERRADGGYIVWFCRCDCGKTTEVSSKRLQRGKVRSCGCLSAPQPKDYVGKRFGRLTVLAAAGKINPKKTENYWRCRCDCGNETLVGQTELQNGDTRSCGCLQREHSAENKILIENTSVAVLKTLKNGPRKDNKSGCTGVFQKKNGEWIAYINFQKKRYWLGCFPNKEKAVLARMRGEEMHDDFLAWYQREYPSENN